MTATSTTVSNLNAFVTQHVTLPESISRKATAQQHRLIQFVQQQLPGVEKSFLSGSAARGTWCNPINDIDIFVVLQPQVLYDNSVTQLGEYLLRSMKGILSKSWTERKTTKDGKEKSDWRTDNASEDVLELNSKTVLIRQQKTSVGICFGVNDWNGADLTFDLVPAIALSHDRYLICTDGKVVISNPKAAEKATEKANKESSTNGQFVQLVRLVKVWNKLQEPTLFKSFHLEVLCQRVVSGKNWKKVDAIEDAFCALLTGMFSRVDKKIRVPGFKNQFISFPDDDDVAKMENCRNLLKSAVDAAKVKNWSAVFGATWTQHFDNQKIKDK